MLEKMQAKDYPGKKFPGRGEREAREAKPTEVRGFSKS
jgi:hypothetical protein